jgi:hypothetical protein
VDCRAWEGHPGLADRRAAGAWFRRRSVGCWNGRAVGCRRGPCAAGGSGCGTDAGSSTDAGPGSDGGSSSFCSLIASAFCDDFRRPRLRLDDERRQLVGHVGRNKSRLREVVPQLDGGAST